MRLFSDSHSVFRHSSFSSWQISLQLNSSPHLARRLHEGVGISIIGSLPPLISLGVFGQQIHKSIMVLMIYPTDPSWITAELKMCRSGLKLQVALTFIALLPRRSPSSMSVARNMDRRAFWIVWQSDRLLCYNIITFIFSNTTFKKTFNSCSLLFKVQGQGWDSWQTREEILNVNYYSNNVFRG